MTRTSKSAGKSAQRAGGRGRKPRVLIFIVAYNAETTIEGVLSRIPAELQRYDTEILIIDDASQDDTFERGEAVRRAADLPFKLTVLFNPVNQGYGGNQKIGFHYAIEKGFDHVALLHGDGQYAPECLPDLLQPLIDGEADAVFGSRMLSAGAARAGGMPLYKYLGNRILTGYQNRMLGADLSEFHSGYRLYSVDALRKVPFHLNANVFHFDTEIIVQLLFAGLRIEELPIPTYYGDEICHVNGWRYAWDVAKATFLARVQRYGIFYCRHFDVVPDGVAHYESKLDFPSPHSRTLALVEPGARVVDVGCGGGHTARALKQQGCTVTGVDRHPLDPEEVGIDGFVQHDLNDPDFPVDLTDYNAVLLLDVVEHVQSPEDFVEALYYAARRNPDCRFIVSSGNIGFIVARLMLLIGQFNYGKRGILDLTHSRLFTFESLIRMFEQAGFRIDRVEGIPAPFPLALGEGWAARALFALNKGLIRLMRGVFSYQMLIVARPLPSLAHLLDRAREESHARATACQAAE